MLGGCFGLGWLLAGLCLALVHLAVSCLARSVGMHTTIIVEQLRTG